jgi:ATP-binding cassette subfamily B multidrug efflux pump
LPGGYDFVLNEDGSNISQGQRQLITIARAICSKPKIMILDEATSSVDTRTEKAIQDAMDDIMKSIGPLSSSPTAYRPSRTPKPFWS